MREKKILSIVLAFALIITAGVMSVGTQDVTAAGMYDDEQYLFAGDTYQFSEPSLDEGETAAGSATYTVRDSATAVTVNSSGLITAVSAGEAVVESEIQYNRPNFNTPISKYKRCKVYVASIYMYDAFGIMRAYDSTAGSWGNSGVSGNTFTLKAMSQSTITWSSADPSTATVEVISVDGNTSTARVTMIKNGEINIIATDANNNSTYLQVGYYDYSDPENPTSGQGGCNNETISEETIEEIIIVSDDEETSQATSSQSDAGAPSVGQSYTISPDGTIGSSVRSSTGVLVAGDQKALPAGTVLAPTNAENTSASFTAAAAAVSRQLSNASVAKVIELNLTGPSGEIHQLDSYVTVTLPRPGGIPVGEGQTISVFRVDPNGKLTRCETTFNDYQIVFKTNHFSTFAFVVENASAAKSGTAPKTGEE